MAIVALFLVVVLVGLVVFELARRTRVSSRDVTWLAGGPATEAEGDVYSQYLRRHRLHRTIGGLFGASFAIINGVRWYGAVSIGFGDGGPLADVLTCGLAGVLVGALSAETYRLTQPKTSTMVATLNERPVTHDPRIVGVSRALAAVALVLGLLVVGTGHGSTSIAIAIGGAAVAAVAEATRSAIATRRRPALSTDAEAVDLNIRRFALRSVELLQFGAAILTVGWVMARAGSFSNDIVTLIQFVIVLGSLVLTVLALRRAAPRPPRHWVFEPA